MMKNVSILVAAFGASIALWGCKDTVQDDIKQCMETATKGYQAEGADCEAVTKTYAQCLQKVYDDHKGDFAEGDYTEGEIQQQYVDNHGNLKQPYEDLKKAQAECAKNKVGAKAGAATATLQVKTEAHADTKKAEPTSLAELEVHQQKLGGKHSSHKHTHAHVTVEVPADGHARQIPEPKA